MCLSDTIGKTAEQGYWKQLGVYFRFSYGKMDERSKIEVPLLRPYQVLRFPDLGVRM
jgi:hypothetical protein